MALNLLVVHQGLRWALDVGHPRVGTLRRFECDADVLAELGILDEPPHVGVGRDGPGGFSGFRASLLCPQWVSSDRFQGAGGEIPLDLTSRRPARFAASLMDAGSRG